VIGPTALNRHFVIQLESTLVTGQLVRMKGFRELVTAPLALLARTPD